MNLYTKLVSLFLAIAMILPLSACSGNTDKKPDVSPEVSDTTETPQPSGSSSLLPEDFEADTSVKDLCLATAGIPGDFELLSVNGQPIAANMYLYWLASCLSEIEASYAQYNLPLDWSDESGLVEYAMADALNASLMYTLIPAKARELGLELSAEQQEEFETLLADSITQAGGEETFNNLLRMLGVDRNTYRTINIAPYYVDLLLPKLFLNRPNEDDLVAYAEANDILCAKHILLLTMDMTTRQPLADDVIAQKKATAEDILKQLQESTDPTTTFDALMHQYSEDRGLTANPDGYTFGAGEMVTEFENGTRELEFGQISSIVESPYGYHIILRQLPDTEELRNACLTGLVSAEIDTWIDQADVSLSEEYENLNVQLFFETFIAYQMAFSMEHASNSVNPAP